MRSSIVALVLLVAAAGLVLAATEEMAVETATGQVSAVDVDAGTFTVQPGDSDPMIFHVDDHTKIIRGGNAGGLATLKVGDQVTVNYKEKDGKYVALSVGIQ